MKTTIKNECSNITENNSVVNDTTVTPDGISSTGLVSDSTQKISTSEFESFMNRLNDSIEQFNTNTPENHSYEPNLESLEETINILKSRLQLSNDELYKIFFCSIFKVSPTLIENLYEELIDRSNECFHHFKSFRDQTFIGFSLKEINYGLNSLQENQTFCYKNLLRPKTKNNVYLKIFLKTSLEYESILKLIEEKVIKNKVTPKFFNQINGKVLFYEKKLSKLLSDVVELFEKEKSSNIDWVLYNDLIMKITYSLKIEPGLFDYIFLPKDNDFETVESEFLKFFNDFEEFNLEDYNPEEFRDYISLNNEVY